jgi:xanthine dehydrogenase YagR molybdenum-binding subunit
MQEQKPKRKIKVPRVVDGHEEMVEIEVDDTGGPDWGPRDAHALLNSRLVRVDGPIKAAGAAVYTYDVRRPGLLYARVLRSPHARAAIRRIDASRAVALPGVKAVVELNDPIMFEGQPVAAVAALTPEIARDALRAIAVDYDVQPHAVTVEAALAPGAPKATQDPNVERLETRGDAAKVDAALATAGLVTVEAEYRTAVIHHACLETHGVVVDYSGGSDATVYVSTQGTFSARGDAARELGIQESGVTTVVEHMGGGFGSKFGLGIEGMLACRLSKKAGAPVKLMLTREDEFVLAGNRSGSWQKLKAGVTRDGKLHALRAEQYRMGGLGDGSQPGQPYIYKLEKDENLYREVSAVHTSTDASRAMRAPGHPQASFAIESLMDALAYKIGMDPVELRKQNLADRAYHRQLDRGAREIGWERRNKVAGGGATSLKRGLGCAVAVWGGGGRPGTQVDVTIGRDGGVTVAVGTQDLGTGTRTYVRAIVAEDLGLPLAAVREQIGSSRLGNATPSGGSTTTASLAPAVKDAAFKARTQMAERVAAALGVDPKGVVFAGGKVEGGGKSLGWAQACAALPAAGLSVRGEWKADLGGLGVHGVCFAEVEVDIETGHVRPVKMVHVQDVGLPLNRTAIESQIVGGMIQALGMALYEERVMDAALGVHVNPRFTDYKLPGTLEMPELVAVIDDGDDRNAVIGVSEPAVVPGVGALANAVYNACGVQIRELPITPDKVLMAVMQARVS